MTSNFKTVPNHHGFSLKNLFGREGDAICRGDLAHIQPGGYGPAESHFHDNAHLFIVLDGVVEVKIDDNTHRVSQYESLIVPGGATHKMFNNSESIATVIGIELDETNKKEDIPA